jgi:hypothetical protein
MAMSEASKDENRNFTSRFLKAVQRIIPVGSSQSKPPTLQASYKPPVEYQVKQPELGEAWWRNFDWLDYTSSGVPGVGIGFSIHPDRTTVVKDDKGIHIYTFQELWSIYSEKFPIKQDVVEVENIRKPIEYIEIPRMRVFTLSYNRQRKEADWQEVRSIIRHQYKGKLVHLNQTIGETVVTPNHSVYNENGDVVSAKNNPNLLYIRKIPTSVTITDSFTLPYPIHKRKESGKYGRIYVAKNLIKRQMNKEELLAFSRFLGAYVAEGCYWFYDGGRKGLVHISNNNVQWLESLGKDAEKFMERVKWRIDKQSTNPKSGKSTYCLSIRSSDLASVLALMVGKGAENKRVPEFLFEADKIFRDAFLINYTVGDGETLGKYSITNEGAVLQYDVVFNGATRSIKLASGLAVLLAMDGNDFSVKSYIDHHGKRMYSIKKVSHHSFKKNSKKISYIDYEGFLFDISVRGDFTDNTQNFVDAMGLIVAHQTVYPFVAVWEKVWGAVPMDDFAKYKTYFIQEPFISSTINSHVDNTLSTGFEIDYPLKEVQDDIMHFLERHDFFNLLKAVLKDMLVMGNAYMEVVRMWICPEGENHDMNQLMVSYVTTDLNGRKYWWTNRLEVVAKHNELYPEHRLENPYGEITRLVPLDPTYMRVRRDSYGTVLGYAQYYVAPIVTFLADEIIHLRYMPTSWTYEAVYGVSMLRSILFHQELIKNYEQVMGAIMNVYLKPMFLVRVGGQGLGQEVTTAQFQQIKQIFQARRPGTDLVFRASAPVQIETINAPIDRMQTTAFWLEWLHNMRAYALLVPKFMVDPAGVNKATATVLQEAYFSFINSIRLSLASQLKNDLFKKIMRSLYGLEADEIMREFGLPTIVWKPIKEESFADKAGIITNLYAQGIISKNEARQALGYQSVEEAQENEMVEATPRQLTDVFDIGGEVEKEPQLPEEEIEELETPTTEKPTKDIEMPQTSESEIEKKEAELDDLDDAIEERRKYLREKKRKLRKNKEWVEPPEQTKKMQKHPPVVPNDTP